MRKPIVLPYFIRAVAACLAVALSTAPGTWAATGTAQFDYEVVDGAILVFGHRLETDNPLPVPGDCEACSPIGFHRSPDGRWILIVSDVRLTANDIWIYDTSTGAAPRHVIGERHGRHLDTNWHSDSVFELRWIGMGYSRSLLFDAPNPGAGTALDDLLRYDAVRDIYVRYRYDDKAFSDTIEIGSVFSPAGKTERFPVVLGGTSRADAIYQFESVEISGSSVFVTYIADGKVTVTAEFSPEILRGRP